MPALSIVAPPSTPENDPVPADLRAVIELFTRHLATVSFPDVDAASLRQSAEELRAAANNVTAAREALATASAAMEARRATLADAAARAIAYARIYGEAHPERHAILAALANLAPPAPPAQASTSGKRRGRPPKQRESAELFDSTPAEVEA